jgi:hypothetical protein
MRVGVMVVAVAVGTTTVAAAQAGAGPADSLRFAWANGSALAIRGKTYVWCGKWDDGTNVRTLRVQQGSPFSPPWWSFEVLVGLGSRGRRIMFPVLIGRSGTMFVAYPRKQLEASADSERSRGTVTILDAVSCRPGSRVRLSVRATLAGEEAGGPSLRVSGTFTGTVGTTPAPGVQP